MPVMVQAAQHYDTLTASSSLMGDFGVEQYCGGPDTPDRAEIHDVSGAEDEGEGDFDDEDDEDGPPADSDFLNFSFKNLELLGERNKEMAEKMSALRAEVGTEDPYSHGWLPSNGSATATATTSATGTASSASAASNRP